MSLSNQLFVASCQRTASQRGSKSKHFGLKVAPELQEKTEASFLPKAENLTCSLIFTNTSCFVFFLVLFSFFLSVSLFLFGSIFNVRIVYEQHQQLMFNYIF